MKCPHCGMNIRDNVVECGYCGGKIARRPEKPQTVPGRGPAPGQQAAKAAAQARMPADEDDAGEDEEEGGLSRILQPGEQVLIGALNVSVKKFFFHAYLTGQRIFLVDTQEKKLKVTAKDIPRDTIAGSIVEFSETSDPVLVLSIRSSDDEIKTMKLVFVQNGTDRSGEIDEWIALLQEDGSPKKAPQKKTPQNALPPEPEPVEEESEPEPEPPVQQHPPQRPLQRQELQPARKPIKDHERQPPVKRIISPYRMPEEEPEPEPEPEVVVPQRRPVIRQVPEPVKRQVVTSEYDHETAPAAKEPAIPHVRKPEVQSAMKGAIKGAVRQAPAQPVKRMVAQPIRHVEPEPEFEPEPEPEPVVQPQPVRRPVAREIRQEQQHTTEEPAEIPQFCHNCGKKLPHAANFCPGCGTKLGGQHRTLPNARMPSAQHADKRLTRTDPPGHDSRTVRSAEDHDEDDIGEVPAPIKPPVKKAPKGSEMTILHKFLRR